MFFDPAKKPKKLNVAPFTADANVDSHPRFIFPHMQLECKQLFAFYQLFNLVPM